MSVALNRLVAALVGSRPVAWLAQPLTLGHMCILTLHRFACDETGVTGADCTTLRRTLERLRRERYNLLDLETGVRQLNDGQSRLRRAVVFTIDDGYADLAQSAADVFLAFDCPVTIFLSTEFVSQEGWNWWDQIELICLAARRTQVSVALDDVRVTVRFGTPQERHRAAEVLWEHLKQIPDTDKRTLIREFAAAAEVDLPKSPPPQYSALTWSQVRALEARGFRFGPHGVTHPILSRTDDRQSYDEIVSSWTVVQKQVSRPVPIFAYPNGRPEDFGPREIDTLQGNGIVAAVTTVPGYASSRTFEVDETSRYRIPRFGYPGDVHKTCLLATGLWRVASRFRPEMKQSGSDVRPSNDRCVQWESSAVLPGRSPHRAGQVGRRDHSGVSADGHLPELDN